jgi:ornithine cyclodeaminase/alanine dehydrogenase-like protein (mu-crystallin family)
MASTLRFLGAADVAALLPPPAEILALCEAALRKAGEGGGAPAAGAWTARFDASGQPGLTRAAGAANGALSALAGADGQPALVVDARSVATAREAACTTLAVRHLAAKDAEVVAILGCNPRGRAVMDTLVASMHVERMLCFDPDVRAQAEFADHIMQTHNVASVVPPEPRECTEGAHIVVTCLQPALPSPVIERTWLQAGALCIALDVDNTFQPATLAAAARRVTGSLAEWRACAASGHFPGVLEPDTELAALVAGKAPGRPAGKPLIAYMAVGAPVAEAAIAAELLRRAEQANRGAVVPA